jgi:uracil phosphoribosyltransferase
MTRTLDHPLVAAKLTRLRARDTDSESFRRTVRELAAFLVPEVTAGFAIEIVPCQTPLEVTDGARLARPIVLAPVLRAGLGMLEGFLSLLPEASVAHVGLARDEETLEPASYYFRVPPNLDRAEVIVVDPMLATGGSAIEAIRQLRNAGAKRLRIACLVAAPEGIAALEAACPDVPLFTATIDRQLNERGYILPGLGDAGDRIFGTPE